MVDETQSFINMLRKFSSDLGFSKIYVDKLIETQCSCHYLKQFKFILTTKGYSSLCLPAAGIALSVTHRYIDKIQQEPRGK
jgi:hypothetical protein